MRKFGRSDDLGLKGEGSVLQFHKLAASCIDHGGQFLALILFNMGSKFPIVLCKSYIFVFLLKVFYILARAGETFSYKKNNK